MKKRKNNKIVIILIIATIIIAAVILTVFLYKKRQSSKPTPANQLQSTQDKSSETTNDNQTSSNQASPSSSSSAQSNTPVVAPKQPTFTKSSGNNGSIPSGVLVNFVCNSEAGTTCQIILTSGTKQIALAEQKVSDNGRGGQTFASWDWKSITGSWTVVARAKNSQGGSTDSIKQALEVQ